MVMVDNKKAVPPPRATASGSLPHFAVFSSHHATTPEDYRDMAGLLTLAGFPSVGPKDQAKLIAPHDGQGKTKEHAQDAMFGVIVIDHDDGDLTEADIRRLYREVKFLAYTTSSHTPEHPRWRVLIPLKSALPAKTAIPLAEAVAHRMGADPAQARLTQGFYAPNKLTEESPYSAITDSLGQQSNWLDIEDKDSEFLNKAREALRQLRRWKQAEEASTPKPRQLTTENNRIIDLIKRGYSLSDLLERHGYQKRGPKYLSPNSQSKVPGVALLPGDRIYSHHGPSDPLSASNHDGHSLDVADVLCCLEYSGDFGKMVRTEAGKLDPEGQKQRQKEFAQQQAQSQVVDQPSSKVDAPQAEQNPFLIYVDMQSELKPLDWVIKEFIAEGLVVIAGEPGIGKTSALIPLACAAAGIHEPGYELAPPEDRWRHVVYITEDSIQARHILHCLADHLAKLGVSNARDLIQERFHLVEARRSPVDVLVEAAPHYKRDFSRTVTIEGNLAQALAKETKAEIPPLVVIDTVSATIDLENENDNSETSRVVNALKQQFEGSSLWATGHVPKSDFKGRGRGAPTMRGASAFEGDANQVLYLRTKGDTPETVSRYLERGKTRFQARWRHLEIETVRSKQRVSNKFGELEVLSLLCGILRPPTTSPAEVDEDESIKQKILSILEEGLKQGKGHNKASLIKEVKKNKARVIKAIDQLIKDGWIVEIEIPKEIRLPNKPSLLIRLTESERKEYLARGLEAIPEAKRAIPEGWKI